MIFQNKFPAEPRLSDVPAFFLTNTVTSYTGAIKVTF